MSVTDGVEELFGQSLGHTGAESCGKSLCAPAWQMVRMSFVSESVAIEHRVNLHTEHSESRVVGAEVQCFRLP